MSSVPVPSGRFLLLNQLRAVAALSVIYSHLIGNFVAYTNQDMWLDETVHTIALNPLGFHDNGGWLGVSLFFFISGFVVSFSGMRATRRGFITRRAVRVYVTLVVVVLALAIVSWCGVAIWTVDAPITFRDVVANASLAVFPFPGSDTESGTWLPAAWTLVTEVLFYLVILAIMPILQRRSHWAPAASLVVIATVLSLLSLVEGAGRFVAYGSMLPLMVLGQATYLLIIKKLTVRHYLALVVAAPATTMLLGLHTHTAFTGRHAPSFAGVTFIAFVMFLAAVFAEGRVGGSKILEFVAKRSYASYLVHIPVGYSVLIPMWENDASVELSILVALAAVGVAVEVVYQLTERPTKALLRRMPR